MRRTIVKEGPLVFLRNVFVMELAASAVFFALSFLFHYEEVVRGSGLLNYIRYDILEIILFSSFQLIYIVILFLDWYFTHYEIYEKEIVKKSGLIFRRRKSVSMATVASVEIYQSPLGRLMHHATIILEHSNGRITKLKNVGNFEEHVHVIKQSAHSASGRILTRDPKVLIEEGESLFVEFKETLRYDARKGEISKELERMVLKTIVAFLNAEGGTLLIGVSDNGTIKGLADDYKTLTRKDRDGFENHLNTLIKTQIGMAFVKYVSISFEIIDDRDVCLVTVREGHKPAYLQNGDKKEDFFVRVGNSTQPFSMSETEEYIKTHWK